MAGPNHSDPSQIDPATGVLKSQKILSDSVETSCTANDIHRDGILNMQHFQYSGIGESNQGRLATLAKYLIHLNYHLRLIAREWLGFRQQSELCDSNLWIIVELFEPVSADRDPWRRHLVWARRHAIWKAQVSPISIKLINMVAWSLKGYSSVLKTMKFIGVLYARVNAFMNLRQILISM